MARRIDYSTVNRSERDRYLIDDPKYSPWRDIILPVAEMGLFFTRPGHKLMGAVAKGIGTASFQAGRSTRRGIKSIYRAATKVKVGGLANTLTANAPAGMATGARAGANILTGAAETTARATYGIGKRAFTGTARTAGRILETAAKYPSTIRRFAVAGAALYGGLRALNAFSPNRTITREMDVAPGFPRGRRYKNVKRRGEPLRPGHMGATGDLTFALHQGR